MTEELTALYVLSCEAAPGCSLRDEMWTVIQTKTLLVVEASSGDRQYP
jgi:hypothetical protein